MNMPYSRLCAGSVWPWFVETLLWFSPSQVEEYSNTCKCNKLELNGIHFQLCGLTVHLEEETPGRRACSGS